eukprot:1158965-Pelagomonas_calceolata.AAC.3
MHLVAAYSLELNGLIHDEVKVVLGVGVLVQGAQREISRSLALLLDSEAVLAGSGVGAWQGCIGDMHDLQAAGALLDLLASRMQMHTQIN